MPRYRFGLKPSRFVAYQQHINTELIIACISRKIDSSRLTLIIEVNQGIMAPVVLTLCVIVITLAAAAACGICCQRRHCSKTVDEA